MARTPRKTPSKPHVPYRGDNPAVGKKTGVKVAPVARTSDGFERFHDLLSQVDSRTPPRRRKKKSMPRVSDGGDDEEEGDQDDDSDGETSMDLDSPTHYYSATTTPRTAARRASPDFDAIPSPRARKSIGEAGPSRLPRSFDARELLDEDAGDETGGMDGPDPYEADPLGGTDEEETVVEPPKSKGKGKNKALTPVYEDNEEDIEDDIARGLDASDEPPSEEEEEPTPPPKKPRASPVKPPKPKQVRTKLKENRPAPEGVRRSKRVAYPPLEYWRGEHVVYGPREEGQPRQVPHITEIVRLPKEAPEPLRPGSKRKRGRSRTNGTPEIVEREVIVEIDASNPEAGWDDDTDLQAVVLDYETKQPVTRRVGFTSKMFNPKPVRVSGPDDAWSFEKIFGDDDFMAAGQLVIPPKKRKPVKSTKDNTYIFYVVEGGVSVHMNETTLVLTTGGMFMVPRMNSYLIENISTRPAKLFFTQARKIMQNEDEDGTPRPVSISGKTEFVLERSVAP